MLDLKPIELKDKEWIDRLVAEEDSPSADFNFGNMYMWDPSFQQEACELGGRLVVCPRYSEPFFAWPVGGGELAPVLDAMAAHAKAENSPFVIRGVTAENLPALHALYPGRVSVTEDRDLWDYLYDSEKLATLSGKKMHGKRNHCNRFEAENEWSYRELEPADLPACKELLDFWMDACGEDARDGIDNEYLAIGRGFADYGPLALEGGVLFVRDKLCAFTIGEKISSDTFDVHFEKALWGVNGAYPMINREFVRQIRRKHPEIRWINREDDTGRESLRQSKLSYHPDRMVEKYTAVIADE